MARINLLDAQTSNLIAAGEVVERPANVLKELLENAIDAKSTAIVTEIRGGGVDLIRVTDNGSGMEKDDLPLCIRRHATSKIRTAEDLQAIETLGFRGEALAAISSTSRFTVLTKRPEDEIGHQMTVEGEEILSLEEAGSADGTTVIVRDLFFNQPARRKFLKRAQTEAAAILQYIQRIAVSHPEISFRHIAEGVVKLQTVGNGKLIDCIWSVYGKEFASSLVPIEAKEGPFTLRGFITRPEHSRNNHSYQSFYINSRFVKSRTMQFALEDAYKSFVKSEKFPGCVIFLELNPAEVDVNVHPAKLEVRFSDERSVYNALYSAVRRTLSNLSNRLARDEYEEAVRRAKAGARVEIPRIRETAPPVSVSREVKIDTRSEVKYELPLFSSAVSRGKSPVASPLDKPEVERVTVETVTFDLPEEKKPRDAVLPEESQLSTAEPTVPEKKEIPSPPRTLPKGEEKKESLEEAQLPIDGIFPEKKESNPLTEVGGLRGCLFHAYLIYETRDKVYLVDKHAAHERILYEALKKVHKSDAIQLFLEPQLLTLSPVEWAGLSEHLKELEEAGFLMEEFGENSFLIRGIPLEFISLSPGQITGLLEQAARELQLGGRAGGAAEKKFDRTLYSMACKAAVKAGIPSTDADHEWILAKLREIDNVTVCPHGRPVLVAFTKKEIENLFLRD
ncbi:MAG: DNA mismatch repair endonuclease MutL [Clostridia bacterium]|nr:DNA mismatch repair endonuclease MutL [Clostridia bacterium]